MINLTEIQNEFAQAMRERDLVIVGLPKMDGKWHHVKTKQDRDPNDPEKGKKSGAYRGFLDGKPAGSIHNFKKGIQDTWVSGINVGEQDMHALRQEAAQQKILRANAKEQTYLRLADLSQAIWDKSVPAADGHPYLKRKQVVSVDLRAVPVDLQVENVLVGKTWRESAVLRKENPGKLILTAGDLIMPLRDVDGKAWSFQTIAASGMKGYLKDAKKLEHFHTLGHLENGKPIIIGEGYATMATLHDVSNRVGCVAVCDTSNLSYVSQIIRDHYPDSKIYFGADNDWELEIANRETSTPGNPGLDTARAAAEKCGGYVLYPSFTPDQVKCSDWNDLYVTQGKAAVKTQLMAQLNQAKEHFSKCSAPADAAGAVENYNSGVVQKKHQPSRLRA